MSLPWLPQTPGIIISVFTDAEEILLQGLANLPFQDGDLIYYDNGAFQRLPIGSAGEILTVVSDLPSWEPSGSTPVNRSVLVYMGL